VMKNFGIKFLKGVFNKKTLVFGVSSFFLFEYTKTNITPSVFGIHNIFAKQEDKVQSKDPSESDINQLEEEIYNTTSSKNHSKLTKEELSIKMYQYEVCPFCCKTRAFLNYYQIPFEKIEVDPVFKSELKSVTEYRKVPVLFVNGEQIVESSKIITKLFGIVNPKDSRSSDEIEKERIWRIWADKKFVIYLPPNIYRNLSEAQEAFEYILDQQGFSWTRKQAIKYVGSTAMYAISQRLKTKYGIINEREEFFKLIDDWTNEIGNNKYLGKSKPNLADLAIFGYLSSIEGFATFREMLQHNKKNRIMV